VSAKEIDLWAKMDRVQNIAQVSMDARSSHLSWIGAKKSEMNAKADRKDSVDNENRIVPDHRTNRMAVLVLSEMPV